MNINASLIGQMITFAVFVLFTMRYVWPAISQAIDEREQMIKSGLAAAKQGHIAQQEAQNQREQILKQAKDQAAQMISQAQDRARHMEDEAQKQAQERREQIIELAAEDIDKQKRQVVNDMVRVVSTLVIDCAQTITEQSIRPEDNTEIIAKLKASVADQLSTNQAEF